MKQLRIVGLGPGGVSQMSVAAYRAVKEAGHILARTERHPAIDDLRAEGVVVESLDYLYDTGVDFDTVYEAITDTVLSEAEAHPGLLYVVPGHPLLGERTVSLLLERATEHGLDISITPSPGFVDAALTAALATVDADLIVLDTLSLAADKLDARLPALLYQVHDGAVASTAKLVLMERYPDEHPVQILREGHPPVSTPLHELDRHLFDHLTSVWIPPVPEDQRRPTFDDLARVIHTLRAPGGCPWDREQTHETIKRNLLEEAYEVAEAIEKDDPVKLEEELGDYLMQPVMHAVIAEDEGVFTLDDIIAGITEKLIRRHPHVFGDVDADDTETVLKNWEAIKRKEKGNEDRTSILDGVPVTMPALMRAMDISKKAAKAGFEWPDAAAVLDKVQEEISELRAEIEAGDKPRAAEEMGDLLFSLVNIARWLKIDPEESLRRMVDRFRSRFHAMESEAARNERDLKSLTPEEWDVYWEQAKVGEY